MRHRITMAHSLWPREHGAYVQLAAPALTALAARTPTVAAASIAIAAGLAFLGNEPLLVALGHRGARRRQTDGPRAVRRLVLAAITAAVAATIGLVLAPHATLPVAAITALPAAILVGVAWRRAEHSLGGELIAAIALPGAAAPIGVAVGLPPRIALAAWAAWAIGYACTVIAVHRVIARHRRPPTRIDAIAAATLAAITIASAAISTVVAVAGLVVPLAAISTALALRPPAATHLRRVGVTLAVASVGVGAIAIAVL
jgi:hypothetical protein